MTHIHSLIDFTIAVYIVFQNKVIFIHHEQLNKWLPVGGHIELDEDPEQALFREIEEETGLTQDKLTVLSNKPNFKSQEQKYLFTPNLLDIHRINETHKHIGITYFIKSSTNQLILKEDEHNNIKWFTESDLEKSEYQLRNDIVYAAKEAIKLSDKTHG